MAWSKTYSVDHASENIVARKKIVRVLERSPFFFGFSHCLQRASGGEGT